MEALDMPAFEARIEAFDAAVIATPDIDHFCSSSAWVLPASQAMMPPRRSFIHASENGFAALMLNKDERIGRYLQPLEAAWCFASGLAGPEPIPLVLDTYLALRAQRREWDVLLLSGLVQTSELFNAAVMTFGQTYRLFTGMTTRRHLASLRGGVDGFLSRRSANFRKALKKSRRRGQAMGIGFETCQTPSLDECDALYNRITAVEGGSWKGLSGAGIESGNMHDFYQAMLPRLVAGGMLRLIFARHEGRDVGFILGAVQGDVYRGLQFSFDDEFRELGLGNLLQMSQIEALAAEGVATYDLGSDAPYKRRWAEQQMDTVLLIIRR